jgi:hypothetical protein
MSDNPLDLPVETPTLLYDDPSFSPLDHTQLNDFRRRIVSHRKDPSNNPEVSDEELRYAIQTLLYHAREHDLKAAAPKKKATRAKPLAPDVNFDDLLNTPM